MSKPLTPAERAAWDAIGHAQEHWTAVLAALKAAAPYHRDGTARNIASILDDYEMTEAAELVRNFPAWEAAMAPAADALRAVADEFRAQLAAAGIDAVHALAETFPDAVELVSPPQSTETPDESTPDDPSTPDAVEAATAWLLADHDERVTTGTVRPASERAAELAAIVRPLIAAATLRAAAARIANLPQDHECDSGRGDARRHLEQWADEMGDSCGG